MSFSDFSTTPDSPGVSARAITPGSSDISPRPRRVVVLATGNATIVPEGNANEVTITFTGLPVGYILPYYVRRVTAATATLATVD
jgi:hypothetical protein